MTEESTEAVEPDTCRPVEVDGQIVRVRGTGDLTKEGEEALAALVRVAKAKFVADAPDKVGELQNRLRLAHQARRAKEHQLDGIRRALCDAGFMDDDDPYSHADLAVVIRQVGQARPEAVIANALAEELHRRTDRLEKLAEDPDAVASTVSEVRGEVIGLWGALGIVLGGTVPGGTADGLAHAYYRDWLDRQKDVRPRPGGGR